LPRYRIEGKVFRRKNLYIPCVIAEKFDELSPEKKVEVFKKTWWCDLLTEAEWRTILGQNPPNYKSVVKSRLKKKAVGWLIALGRILTFEPDIYNKAVEEAIRLYRELCGLPHPMFEREEFKKEIEK